MKPRTKKKPRSKKSTEQNDTEDEDDNDDSMKPRAKKKPRSKKSSSTSSTMATTSVPLDAFNIVMAFLHPRDLLHTAFTCKSLRDMVSTSMVIKSALVHGGHAKSTMEVLFALTSKHAMHIPSPLRLLRLVNGKVCEFCLYDKVNHARPGIGVFACWACVTSRTTRNNRPLIRGTLTKPWKLSWVRYKKPPTNRVKYDAIFTHDRVAAALHGDKYYMWSENRMDFNGVERVGPIVTMDDVDRIFAHLTSGSDAYVAAINEYLKTNLNAPPIEHYTEFNTAIVDARQAAIIAAQEREESTRAKQTKAKESKIAKVEKMLDDLSTKIDDSFSDFVMKRKTNSARCFGYSGSQAPFITMDLPFVEVLLKPYIAAPSKVNKNTLSEIATTINGKFRMINDTNLLAFEYLSDSDPIEIALKSLVRDILPDVNAIFAVGGCVRRGRFSAYSENHINDTFFNHLQAGTLIEAVVYLTIHKLSPMLMSVESSAESTTTFDETILEKLANGVWENLGLSWAEAYVNFKPFFSSKKAFFENALIALKEYSAWLIDHNPELTTVQITQTVKAVIDSQWLLDKVIKREFDVVWARHNGSGGLG